MYTKLMLCVCKGSYPWNKEDLTSLGMTIPSTCRSSDVSREPKNKFGCGFELVYCVHPTAVGCHNLRRRLEAGFRRKVILYKHLVYNFKL